MSRRTLTLRDRLITYVTTRLSPVDWPHAARLTDHSLAATGLNAQQTGDTGPELPARLTAAARKAIRDHSITYLERLAPPLTPSEGHTASCRQPTLPARSGTARSSSPGLDRPRPHDFRRSQS
ncbi:hypothetical protein [Streptomyces alkaliterrae]|uniref:Uncharacterized protein n=1 Tax=Streptomyces alkaliterrae TaxID=2213162 RepID=A0A5P0YNR9_9ACTN|nr:hypothetical protein [Streptomyces alkaliterrae]MBB1260391.1 hypothetical protein [Streptomyces alkaliterrae]MQS01307.1 hypothetical protein [Streptomyces alkaliterrae]